MVHQFIYSTKHAKLEVSKQHHRWASCPTVISYPNPIERFIIMHVDPKISEDSTIQSVLGRALHLCTIIIC